MKTTSWIINSNLATIYWSSILSIVISVITFNFPIKLYYFFFNTNFFFSILTIRSKATRSAKTQAWSPINWWSSIESPTSILISITISRITGIFKIYKKIYTFVLLFSFNFYVTTKNFRYHWKNKIKTFQHFDSSDGAQTCGTIIHKLEIIISKSIYIHENYNYGYYILSKIITFVDKIITLANYVTFSKIPDAVTVQLCIQNSWNFEGWMVM